MIGVGVIGYGRWGPNPARNLASLDDVRIVAVCDHHRERLDRAAHDFPGVQTSRDHRDLLADPTVDAVVVATPSASHFDLAMQALAAGKHVWVEKPIAETVAQALRLADEADRRARVLVVDHTLVYGAGVRRLAELIDAGDLGRLLHLDATRTNLGRFQDVNVIADLGVHDFAILDHLVKARPLAVAATGRAHFAGAPEDAATVWLTYPGGTTAQVSLSWIAPVRSRRLMVTGSRRMAVHDELEPTAPLQLHDKCAAPRTDPARPEVVRVDCIDGAAWQPEVGTVGPLRALARHFVDCVVAGRRPLTDARAGARMVELIDAANRSMRAGGCPVELAPTGERA